MTTADRPPRDAYLLNVLRRNDAVLWAGERTSSGTPTVIAKDVDAVRAQLPPGAAEHWTWVDSPWSWSEVKAASAGVARLGDPRVTSISVGPREDDSFGVTVEVSSPSEPVQEYVATLDEDLVRVRETDRQSPDMLTSMGMRGVPHPEAHPFPSLRSLTPLIEP
ncbi:MAG: hypothetical protein IPL37_15310 [Austwickia sp.]|jgi:hypothetical protein|nr:hypothetical protein [Austwickia sp.]